jgi:hypothetical protein
MGRGIDGRAREWGRDRWKMYIARDSWGVDSELGAGRLMEKRGSGAGIDGECT